MLILSRRAGERVVLRLSRDAKAGETFEIEIKRGRCSIGFDDPTHLCIVTRKEIDREEADY